MKRASIIGLVLGLSLITGCGTDSGGQGSMEPDQGEATAPAASPEPAEGAPGEVQAASHTCRYEVWNQIPPGDLNGVIEFRADACGSFVRHTYSGPNNQYVDIEAWKYGTNYGKIRLERTANGYVARYQSGNLQTVKQTSNEIAAARAESNLYPKAATATNWNCIWSVTAAVASVATAIGTCSTPPGGWLLCGGAVVASLASIGAVSTNC